MAGPFYFAWVEPGTAFNAAVHNVENLIIGNFSVEQTEGDFATLTVEVKNPRDSFGLLSGKFWAWLSWFNGSEIQPLFFGRLVGIPDDIMGEVISLEFIARPLDYIDQKNALAETLKVAPYYDPIWIDESAINDPDTVLEARSELWSYDRITHEVDTSNLLVGEDGIEDFVLAAHDAFYDSVHSRLVSNALRAISVDGIVNWGQAAIGTMNVLQKTFITGTGKGLIDDWPKTGSSIGGGWSVKDGSVFDAAGIELIDNKKYAPTDHIIAPNELPDEWIFVKTTHSAFPSGAYAEGGFIVPMYHVYGKLILQYDAARDRTEHVRFTIAANVQPVITAADGDDLLFLSLTSRDVGQPLIENAEIPIGDVRRRSYFPTIRGERSIQYLVALARANLELRSRAIEVDWDCTFRRAIALSCRMNARLYDPRLPAGNALGKIISYSFECTDGLMIGHCKIGCAIGYGGSVEAEGGTPDWVSADWVSPGWQTYTGQTILLGSGDVTYSMPTEAPNDDGIVFTGNGNTLDKSRMVSDLVISSVGDAGVKGLTKEETESIINDGGTRVSFTLKPVEGGPFESAYDINVSQLEIPKQIDLEFKNYFGTIAAREGADVVSIEVTS